jgi:dienelactone hydrolase
MLTASCVLAFAFGLLGNEDLQVIQPPADAPAASALLHEHLKQAALAALERRRAKYEALKTGDEARHWQAARREFFLRQLDGLPPRPKQVPARVTGTLSGPGFRVEKVVFESRPGLHVTGLLYLPTSKPPYPAVLMACGHADVGKAYREYQQVCMLLAGNGMAAFCYDPIAQGERSQLFGPDGKRLHHCVNQHTLIGLGCILLGTNTARYRIYDGMRAFDYLLTRPEIDGRRIGVAGNSGGGTESSYLMALDERIWAAAPGCYLTSFARLLETSGPQDAEQNICGQIGFGMDEADYVLMRAPRPTCICASTRDATFDITGTWDTFREAKRFYARVGFPERVDLVETDDRHGMVLQLREGTARWMARWLLGRDVPIVEGTLTPFPEPDTYCTPEGQVLRLAGEKTVFALNEEAQAALVAGRRTRWSAGPTPALLTQVRQLAGIRPLAQIPPPQTRRCATLQRSGYRIEKWLLEPVGGIPVPALAFVPAQTNGDAYLVVDEAGKQAAASPGGPIEALVRAGHLVLAVDPRGVGETEARHKREWYRQLFGANGCEFFMAYLLGQPLVGMQAEDILVAARFLARYDGHTRRVHLAATGRMGVAALHAAALEPDAFAALRLQGTLRTWTDLVGMPTRPDYLPTLVHGALKLYDLPDLARALGTKVRWE